MNKEKTIVFKRLRKICAVILSLTCAFTLISCAEKDDEPIVEPEYYTEGLVFNEADDLKTCQVSGYVGTDEEVVIPNEYRFTPVDAIRESAFEGNDRIVSVKIPDNVLEIGEFAFYGCLSLKIIDVGNGVEKIGDSAFKNCNSATLIKIGDGVTTIEEDAFGSCSAVTRIILGKSVVSIGDFAFDRCSSLTAVFYFGDEQSKEKISYETYFNTPLDKASWYYYSETRPQENAGAYWYYDEEKSPVIWA